jgi:hypothetical protein
MLWCVFLWKINYVENVLFKITKKLVIFVYATYCC